MVAPKREKMACQRSMTQKEREREIEKRGSHVSKKERERERDRDDSREKINALRSKPHPSIHPSIHTSIHSYTCTFFIEIAWLVSPWILSLTLQYMECKYALLLSYLELHKKLCSSRKDRRQILPWWGKYKLSASRESSWELCHVFKKSFKKYLQMDCGSMSK